MHSFNLMFVRTRIAIRLRNPSVWPLFSYRVGIKCYLLIIACTLESLELSLFLDGYLNVNLNLNQILFMEDLPKQVEDSFKLKSVPNNDTKLRHSHRWSSEKGDLHDSEPFFAIL